MIVTFEDRNEGWETTVNFLDSEIIVYWKRDSRKW